MGLVKRTYVDGETVITADNLNDIQDEIIQNASDISTKGTYSKPSGGIPSTDLASAVQTSLEKADTALQSSDIDSTLTVSGKAADAKKTGDEISGVKNTLTQLETNVGKILPVITGSTNNSGYTIAKGDYFEANGALYKATASIPINGAWSTSAEAQTGKTAVNGLKNTVDSLYKSYSKTVNGVTYGLFVFGNIGVLTFVTGSFTNAVSANSTLISLADFSSDLSGKKFASSFQGVFVTDTTKRVNCVNGGNNIISVSALSAGFDARGSISVAII